MPSSRINITVSSSALDGDPRIACKIEVSSTGQGDWRTVAENSLSSYASDFRFARYTFTITGGLMLITNINYRLDVKKKTDFGNLTSLASENGDGFVNIEETPELYGTFVPFGVNFVDVQAGPNATCNETGKTAYVNFTDVQHPDGFRVYVLDANGQRVDGVVSWYAFGV